MWVQEVLMVFYVVEITLKFHRAHEINFKKALEAFCSDVLIQVR